MSGCSHFTDCLGSIPVVLLLGSDLMASLISAILGAAALIRGLLLYRSGSADNGGAFSAKLWLSTEEKGGLHLASCSSSELSKRPFSSFTGCSVVRFWLINCLVIL